MRKAFGILLSLVLVVGLALVTGALVLADASPGWTTITQVAAGWTHTVGLKSDGTVVAVGANDDGQRDVGGWTGISKVAAGNAHTVGLKSDGTVVAVGQNDNGQCNVGNWTDIAQVSAGWAHTVGVKSGGTVVAVGVDYDGRCNVANWTGINQTAAGWGHTVGLKSGGTVVAVGANDDGRCNVGNWTNITQVAAGRAHTVGLKSDGTVVAVGWNDYGQCGHIVTQTVTNDTVDARNEADTEVVVNGTANVTVFRYSSNPGGSPPTGINALGKWIDVYVPDTSQVTEIQIRLYYTDIEVAGIDESSLRLRWWNGSTWVLFSEGGVNTTNADGYNGYIWARIRADIMQVFADDSEEWIAGGYHPPEPPVACGCYIATAAYGTDTARELDILREFRDTVLLPTSLGARLVSFYYRTSPPVASLISHHEALRTAVRVSLVDPIVTILKWTHNLWSSPNS